MTHSRRFILGCAAGILLFLGINALAAQRMSDCGLAAVFQMDACNDDIVRVGWPVKFYEEGGFDYHRGFNTLAMWMDIGLSLSVSAAVGWIAARQTRN